MNAEPKFKLNKEQLIAGSVLMGVGGAIAIAGVALAGVALVAAFRDQVQGMPVPPSTLAKQHWSALKNATSAGANVWLKEQPGAPALPVLQS
jgi:hypothetical protein